MNDSSHSNQYGIKSGAEKFPLMVVVAVSYVCNAKCPNCPYTQSDIRHSYKDTPFIKDETFKRIANECGKYHSVLRLTGGGEPLLHPHMIDLIESAKYTGAKIGLITNGSLLTWDKADRLLAVQTDTIEISADAADRDTYQLVRTGLDFDKLVCNVSYLLAKRRITSSATKVIVSIVNQSAVAGKIDKAIHFWKDIIGVDEVQVRKYLTWGIGDPTKSADITPYMAPDNDGRRTPCPFPFERLNVDSRGKIEFCGFDIAGSTDFGNVNSVSIESVWQGGMFNSWRRLLLDGRHEEIGLCKKCPDWQYRSWDYNYWKLLQKADNRQVK